MNRNLVNPELVAAVLLVFTAAFLAPTHAWAQFNGAIGVANSVVNFLTGPFAIAVATLGCVVCGYLAFAGRLRMETALRMIVGIILVFGAPKLVITIIGFAKGA